MKRGNCKFEKLTLGVCYYPEHWDESMWADDLCRMKEKGIEVIRIAEFAWNKFEPSDGVYTFEFFDKFMDVALAEGIKVIFCTPTATAPVWLSEKYPEILNADIDGNLYYNGMRRQNNLNSPIYREYTRKIVEQLAQHYCKYPNVIGWQLDNEINCEQDLYYSESDHKAFRKYLEDKFGDIDTLNKEMGTVFWNQTYNDWNEVNLTRRTNAVGETNPHMKLEEKRFVSDTVIGFFKLQSDIIKKYRRKDQFITTNGMFRYIDYHKLTDGILDFLTYDNYPNFAFELAKKADNPDDLMDRNSSYNLTRIRSISSPFGIMEQQTGGGGWNCRMLQPMPKPGQMRLWTMQAIAHGADFVSYFRWRTCRFGTEMYWHGLNDYSNKPNRRVKELGEINLDKEKMLKISGAEYAADVAVVKDYDNEWDCDCDKWQEICMRKSDDSWFKALQKKHIPFDFLYIDDETDLSKLTQYKQLVYAHAAILTKKRAELLKAYIAQGGTVIFGCRTGTKELNGQCTAMPMPGYASELCGVEVEEFTVLSDFDDEEFIKIGDDTVTAPVYNEVLEVTDGEVIGTFNNNHYDGKPAMVKKQTGDGTAYYAGSVFGQDTAILMADMSGMVSPIDGIADIPEEIEIAVRENETARYLFLLNYKDSEIEFSLKKEMYELLSGKNVKGKCTIEKYGCLVFEINK